MKLFWIIGIAIFILLGLLVFVLTRPKPFVCPTQGSPRNFRVIGFKELEPWQQQLLTKAEDAMKNSYSPYSHFMVGAALLTNDGEMITGTNYENASYGANSCAERVAIFAANVAGKRKIKAIAIIGKPKDSMTETVVAPCGVCRQAIYEASEIANNDIQIIMSNTDKTKVVVSFISELLPLAFGPKSLKVDISSYF